ncbi:50S ribosomal protein L25 [Alkalidesulfovibrio alkalitolerans DSM 16529]|jgi:large subunit ribosomal protein L25|uniref:Large ribosomal subunit protein bL25 n=1 Tax=Alkalidesulfovibrio alkalitolerans DSM 16529 TaxID=1121439 RepID=S7UGX6_9BACT|nr:50S ribosomal protein L25 [Alkalidesulfovibrio alkalitolerans]EPR31498.1 50S ribosomal protein L25 [Alkalidesulfovibrio alkalitolerans DSM 16529]
MSEQVNLIASARSIKGKTASKAIRGQELVPGIYYNGRGENIMLQVPALALTKAYEKVGLSHVLTLKIEQDGVTAEKPSLIRELKRHPYKRQIMHVDFLGIDLDKKIRVEIPVRITGKCKGVVLGGQLTVFREHLTIECLPLNVPNSIVIDVTEMEIGQNLQVADVKTPEGVGLVYDENFSVVGVLAPEAEAEASEG